MAVRGPHHRDVEPDAVEPDDAVHPRSLDRRLALQLHTELDEERDSSLEVVDDDADIVHSFDRHVLEHRTEGTRPSRPGSEDEGSVAHVFRRDLTVREGLRVRADGRDDRTDAPERPRSRARIGYHALWNALPNEPLTPRGRTFVTLFELAAAGQTES